MLITPDGLKSRYCCCCLFNSGQYFRLGTLICDDRSQIHEAVDLVQFFTVDSDVNADAICVALISMPKTAGVIIGYCSASDANFSLVIL